MTPHRMPYTAIATSALLLAGCAGEHALDFLEPQLQEMAPCDPSVAEAIRSPGSGDVEVNCVLSLALEPKARIQKRIIFTGMAATGSVLDCAGATVDPGVGGRYDYKEDTIEIRSQTWVNGTTVAWSRPEDITLRHCEVVGSIRILGMGSNGEAEPIRDSSRLPGHVDRMRASAPRHITLDSLTITGKGRIPLYLAPGVSETQVVNTEIKGTSVSVAVYFDTESYRNVFENNEVHVSLSGRREVMAIDGSSENRIINNHFSGLNQGGIYLYRNCGEGGTIRITPPRDNQIINNVFFYNEYTGPTPAIYLGSRDDRPRSYCGNDSGYSYGSSSSNVDLAHDNVVAQNQFYRRSVSSMILQGSSSTANLLLGNETVSTTIHRAAGCYVKEKSGGQFILHGQSVDVFQGENDATDCAGYRQTCNNGRLEQSPLAGCDTHSPR